MNHIDRTRPDKLSDKCTRTKEAAAALKTHSYREEERDRYHLTISRAGGDNRGIYSYIHHTDVVIIVVSVVRSVVIVPCVAFRLSYKISNQGQLNRSRP